MSLPLLARAVPLCSALMVAAVWSCAAASDADAPPSEPYSRLVEQLGAEDYLRRTKAADQLLLAGPAARSALVAGLTSADLETRSQCRRLLREIDSSSLRRRLTDLEHQYVPEREYEVAAWDLYRDYCGDGQPHRSLFVRIVRKHPTALQQLEMLVEADDGVEEGAAPEFLQSVSSEQLRSGDAELWTLVLLAECREPEQRFPQVSHRVLEALQDSRVAAAFRNSAFREPLDDLLNRWLARKRSTYMARFLLKVCLVHQRHAMAEKLAIELLERDPSQTLPADRQAALLTLVQVAPQRCSVQLEELLSDTAPSHVWRTSPHARSIVQTEVRDAALAGLLQLSGHDPRDCGFAYLRPDPIMGFREFSIGFVTAEAREQAHARGRRLLALAPHSSPAAGLEMNVTTSHATTPPSAAGGAAH